MRNALCHFSLLASPHFTSPAHLVGLGVFAVLTAAAVMAGRRFRARGGIDGARRLDLGLGLLTATASVTVNIFYLLPSRYDPRESWPLQLCDLAVIAAACALLFDWRWARTLLHFWGIALCSQGLLTPVHRPSWDDPEYIMTWITHGFIVGPAIYDTLARGYRPTWRDWRFDMLATTAYVVGAFILDSITGFNYGYVGPSVPGNPTLVDLLGPWPLRALWVAVIGGTGMTLIMAGWSVAPRLIRAPVLRS